MGPTSMLCGFDVFVNSLPKLPTMFSPEDLGRQQSDAFDEYHSKDLAYADHPT